jgi:hypothetical protein
MSTEIASDDFMSHPYPPCDTRTWNGGTQVPEFLKPWAKYLYDCLDVTELQSLEGHNVGIHLPLRSFDGLKLASKSAGFQPEDDMAAYRSHFWFRVWHVGTDGGDQHKKNALAGLFDFISFRSQMRHALKVPEGHTIMGTLFHTSTVAKNYLPTAYRFAKMIIMITRDHHSHDAPSDGFIGLLNALSAMAQDTSMSSLALARLEVCRLFREADVDCGPFEYSDDRPAFTQSAEPTTSVRILFELISAVGEMSLELTTFIWNHSARNHGNSVPDYFMSIHAMSNASAMLGFGPQNAFQGFLQMYPQERRNDTSHFIEQVRGLRERLQDFEVTKVRIQVRNEAQQRRYTQSALQRHPAMLQRAEVALSSGFALSANGAEHKFGCALRLIDTEFNPAEKGWLHHLFVSVSAARGGLLNSDVFSHVASFLHQPLAILDTAHHAGTLSLDMSNIHTSGRPYRGLAMQDSDTRGFNLYLTLGFTQKRPRDPTLSLERKK